MAAMLAVSVAAAVVSVSGGSIGSGEAAYADAVGIKVGADLLAIQSVSLDDAIVAQGEHVSVTASEIRGGALFLDVALADGHVVKGVPIEHIRKSFRVVG